MCGRSEQVNNEIIPISRHLQEAKAKRHEESFSVLVVPVIHPDTVEAADWQKYKYNLDIITLDINEFIEKLNANNHLSQLLVGDLALGCLKIEDSSEFKVFGCLVHNSRRKKHNCALRLVINPEILNKSLNLNYYSIQEVVLWKLLIRP